MHKGVEIPDEAIEAAMKLFFYDPEADHTKSAPMDERFRRALQAALPAISSSLRTTYRAELEEAIQNEVRRFRNEADQRDRESADLAHDEVEVVRLRGSAAAWRTAADSLEAALDPPNIRDAIQADLDIEFDNPGEGER